MSGYRRVLRDVALRAAPQDDKCFCASGKFVILSRPPTGPRCTRPEDRLRGRIEGRTSRAPVGPGPRGFALLVVLWALVLVAFIVAHLTSRGRTELVIAANLANNAAAEAAADGGIHEAIFNLSNPDPGQRWALDGSPRQIGIGGSRVTLRLEDESDRINPNTAAPALLEALLETTGNDPETAQRLAAAIGDWVGTGSDNRSQDAIAGDYRAAGLSYAPPDEPAETIGELGLVLGMTPEILAGLQPHLSLFADGAPNPYSADPVVAAAIALAARRSPQITTGSFLAAQQRPILTVRIIAAADGPGNAEVSSTAIVRIGPNLPHGYVMLARGGAAG
jgi:general secretion pathway protein K